MDRIETLLNGTRFCTLTRMGATVVCAGVLLAAAQLGAAAQVQGSARGPDDTQVRSSGPDTPAGLGGLEAFKVPEFDQFYVGSEFKMPASRKISLGEVEASFAEVWLDRFEGVTNARYRTRTLQRYSQALVAELTRALQASGWQVVSSEGDDVLRVQPRLFDIYIVAPEVKQDQQTLVAQVGQGGIELEFKTPAGATFMKVVDYRNTGDMTGTALANRATNYRYFRMLMSDWADVTVKYLDKLMAVIEEQYQN